MARLQYESKPQPWKLARESEVVVAAARYICSSNSPAVQADLQRRKDAKTQKCYVHTSCGARAVIRRDMPPILLVFVPS